MDMTPIIADAPEGMLPILIDAAYNYISGKSNDNAGWYISKNATTFAFIIKHLIRVGDKGRLTAWLSIVPRSLHGAILDRNAATDPFIIGELYGNDRITREMLAGRYGHMKVLIDELTDPTHIVEAAVSFRDEYALMICRDSGRFADKIHDVIAKEINVTLGPYAGWYSHRRLSNSFIMACTSREILADPLVYDHASMSFIASIVIYRSILLLDHFMKDPDEHQRLQRLVDIMVEVYCAEWLSRGCLHLAIRGYNVGSMVTERIIDDGHLDLLVIGGHMMGYRFSKSYILSVDDRICPARIQAIIADIPEDEEGNVTIGAVHEELHRGSIPDRYGDLVESDDGDVIIITSA